MSGQGEGDPAARELFDDIAAELLVQPGVARRRMFGRDGLNVNGTFFAFLNHERLVLKLPEATTAALIDAGDAAVATNLSPTMRTWVSLPMQETVSERWRQLMAEARAHAVENQKDREAATASAASAPRQGRPHRRSDARPDR